MKRSVLGPANWPENENFGETMEALGVEVVKPPKPRQEWYKPDLSRNKNAGIGDKISVTKTGITIGGLAVAKMGISSGSHRLKVGITEHKKEKVLLFKSAEDGLKVMKTKTNSYRIGTRKLYEWLDVKGIKFGLYSVKKIDGGWLAMLEKEAQSGSKGI